MLAVTPVPCLSDNYAWLIEDGSGAVGIVDPSEEAPVAAALEARGLALTHIFNTHHHFDHTGGNLALTARYGATIIGPAADRARIPGIDVALEDGEAYAFGRVRFTALDIPGHTRGHIALHAPDEETVFTGDTLFALGCGRMFEGTAGQMWASLARLAALPGVTRAYCGHEYTAANARFALSVEPGNAALQARAAEVSRLRAEGRPTVPSTIAQERATNPFLRPQSAEIARSVGLAPGDDVAVFAAVRAAKDGFR